ncbi:MAG: hypothetical protein R3B70_43435 [Polyangiaceae bacterium]
MWRSATRIATGEIVGGEAAGASPLAASARRARAGTAERTQLALRGVEEMSEECGRR